MLFYEILNLISKKHCLSGHFQLNVRFRLKYSIYLRATSHTLDIRDVPAEPFTNKVTT